jgi:hypothetical protein
MLPSCDIVQCSPRLATCCTLVSCSAYFDHGDGGNTFPRNAGSHTDYKAIYPQKMAAFITTAVRATNPTYIIQFLPHLTESAQCLHYKCLNAN